MDGSLNIELRDARLQGFLEIPKKAEGMVIFAHGSGSSRSSPRNRFVADYLQQRKMGTLLFDLLTEEEEQQDMLTGSYRFNISFLAGRLTETTDWLIGKLKARKVGLPFGFFGASTGAAAAIMAADMRLDTVKAIVSRGGRPDLAGSALSRMTVATLLIVGEDDTEVLKLNREALRHIHAPKDLHIVKGATHLFEEPGTLEEAARAAAGWFEKCFLKIR